MTAAALGLHHQDDKDETKKQLQVVELWLLHLRGNLEFQLPTLNKNRKEGERECNKGEFLSAC